MLFHDFLFAFVQRIRQLVVLELFSFLPYRAYFEFEFLEELFLSRLILLEVEPKNPRCASCNSNL